MAALQAVVRGLSIGDGAWGPCVRRDDKKPRPTLTKEGRSGGVAWLPRRGSTPAEALRLARRRVGGEVDDVVGVELGDDLLHQRDPGAGASAALDVHQLAAEVHRVAARERGHLTQTMEALAVAGGASHRLAVA